jgi:hypothetical protein
LEELSLIEVVHAAALAVVKDAVIHGLFVAVDVLACPTWGAFSVVVFDQ